MLTLDYRPSRLIDLVGQPAVSNPLLRLLSQYKQADADARKKVMPAGFLFKGPRGTGKTSTARIVAMSLNCEGDQVEPCLECSSCRAILNGTKTAVLEMDAASNGLVDDIRKLRESVMFAHDGLYKVIILDEAHSISKEGFNALLKQLEEPNDYVLYILVTTSPEKIIPTVQSRCMHFTFRAIPPVEIFKRLKMVCEQENIPYETAALERVSRYVDGGMRDALMLLDQMRICGKADLAGFDIVSGAVSDAAIYELLKAELTKDMVRATEIMETSLAGVSPQALIDAIAMFLTRAAGAMTDSSPYPQKFRADVNKEQIYALLHVMWDARQMRVGTFDAKATLICALSMICEKGGAQAAAKSLDSSHKLSATELTSMFS